MSLKIIFSINLCIYQVIKQKKSTIITLVHDIIPLHHYRSVIIEEKNRVGQIIYILHMCLQYIYL